MDEDEGQDKTRLDKTRLLDASRALKDASDAFIAAHAEWAGGHRPVLWATYNDCNDAIVVCHKSWAEKICELFEDRKEPVRIVSFPEDIRKGAEMNEFELVNPENVSPHVLRDLEDYVKNGTPLGSFLQAVVSNDLLGAVKRADMTNLRVLPAIVSYLYNDMPHNCHGSREAYRLWLTAYKDARMGRTP